MAYSVEKLIIDEIKTRKIALAKLAKIVLVSTPHLFFVLKGSNGQKRNLSPNLLDRINEALDTSFTLSDQQTSEDTLEQEPATK